MRGKSHEAVSVFDRLSLRRTSVWRADICGNNFVKLRDIYPSGTLYGAPYIPNNPFDRPFSNCDACAGWAMKCSDAAFGNLPCRQITNPSWDEIRAGDLIDWRAGTSGHAVVVLEKTDEYKYRYVAAFYI